MMAEHIGDATLICGDCREALPALRRLDAAIVDPPFGVLVPGDLNARVRKDKGAGHGLMKNEYGVYVDSYANFISTVVPALNTTIDLCTRAAIFTGPHVQEQRKAEAIGGVYCPAGSGRHSWGFKTFLPVLFYGKAPNLHLGAKPNTIQSSAVAEKNGHPCPKPLEWLLWLVNLASLPGEVVVDPFMGSGTTGVACARLGRAFVGIELDPCYFDIACERIEQEQRQLKLFYPKQKRKSVQLSFAVSV
jgi:site-specific DNA-methyltransferase (adenine-specific)